MAKSNKKNATPFWTDGLDEDAVREALEEATVDSHDETEQHSGLWHTIEEQLEFPFQAQVIGEIVTIVDMEWPEKDEFGLDLIVERNGQRHRVEARSVNLLPPLPKGHLYLAAYLDWKRTL
ncbi:hypothetical protein [Fimbriiglobus ruber]|uniref:Uncharacterized protein n=1 Tax=Fimbriiglobus ruber TaxID=1908690 RepID=A0A225E3H4_9BACT|nr:hypothetical protein [Fimbriiglobus ruber]OWK45348.1 hypothetical protein FRUB_01679 [Fimbriiglobus ruber]